MSNCYIYLKLSLLVVWFKNGLYVFQQVYSNQSFMKIREKKNIVFKVMCYQLKSKIIKHADLIIILFFEIDSKLEGISEISPWCFLSSYLSTWSEFNTCWSERDCESMIDEQQHYASWILKSCVYIIKKIKLINWI